MRLYELGDVLQEADIDDFSIYRTSYLDEVLSWITDIQESIEDELERRESEDPAGDEYD